MFDCDILVHVGPIVNYDSYKSLNVERLHLGCCKHILGVKKSACTEVVYEGSHCFITECLH